MKCGDLTAVSQWPYGLKKTVHFTTDVPSGAPGVSKIGFFFTNSNFINAILITAISQTFQIYLAYAFFELSPSLLGFYGYFGKKIAVMKEISSVSKKLGQSVVVIHSYALSQFFLKQTLIQKLHKANRKKMP